MISTAARLLSAVLILLVIFAATRAIIRALPGDPLNTLIAETGTTIDRNVLNRALRLDEPFLPALMGDLRAALRGDLGTSILSQRPVAPVVAERFVNTLILSSLTLLMGFPISLLLGLLAANHPRSAIDRICTLYGALCAALPAPWIGPLLMLCFSVWLPMFPISGSVFLPALTLALIFSGLWARLIRSRVRESLLNGSARGARARGLPEWRVLFKYGLIPVSGSLLAYLGTQTGHLLAGAFVTEIIFDWRGMGHLLVSSVLRRDYPVIEATAFFSAALCLLGNWWGDFLQNRVTPWKE
ncbi:MAG TPA: hypothetical protein DCS07_06880 [Bdellovibrionales bacterium]|nr:hypothetical protein [Bdellovibrionales bacterium]